MTSFQQDASAGVDSSQLVRQDGLSVPPREMTEAGLVSPPSFEITSPMSRMSPTTTVRALEVQPSSSISVREIDREAPYDRAAHHGAGQLEARDVSAWFGSNKVLERVNLTMPANAVTALIGPSGCGKSTFLRVLNRMHELVPSAQLAGEVMLDNQDIYAPGTRITETRKRIGMVFQKPNPFPTMSLADNVTAGLKLNGIKVAKGDREALIERSLTRAGLWKEVKDRLKEPGGALSGGQQQRLCIARSLAIEPEVLLMDEPCSALDPTSTRRVEETIMEIKEQVTVVIVTHNMQQAARVSQKCAFFLAEMGTPGGIVEAGDTAQIFNDPHDPRTNDYVNGRFG